MARLTTLSRIRVSGFRKLRAIDLTMKPLTVLVGPNGSGKTSVLEVLSVLSASCRSQLGARLSELGGVADLVTRDSSGPIELAVHSPVANANPLEYSLRLGIRGQGYAILEESLAQDHGEGARFKHIDAGPGAVRYFDPRAGAFVRPDWEMDDAESALAQVPRMYREPEDFRRLLAKTAFYGGLDVSPKSPVRLPQQMRPAPLPGVRGEDLVNCLFSLREEDPDRFSIVEDALAAGFPDFERLAFPPAAAAGPIGERSEQTVGQRRATAILGEPKLPGRRSPNSGSSEREVAAGLNSPRDSLRHQYVIR